MNRRIAHVHLKLSLPLLCVFAGMTDAHSQPHDPAQSATPALRGGGVVAAGPDGRASIVAIEAAVRADAANFWRPVKSSQLELKVEALIWSDGSLGCPQPGLSYTQALVPGWRLVVRHQARVAVYHASQQGQWLLCPGADPSVKPGSGDSRI